MDKDNFMLFMAAGIVLGAFLYIVAITFMPIPETGQDHAKFAIGFLLGTGVSTIISYFWGSSKGSDKKTDLLSK